MKALLRKSPTHEFDQPVVASPGKCQDRSVFQNSPRFRSMSQSEPVQWGPGHPMFFFFFLCHAPHRMKLTATMIFAGYYWTTTRSVRGESCASCLPGCWYVHDVHSTSSINPWRPWPWHAASCHLRSRAYEVTGEAPVSDKYVWRKATTTSSAGHDKDHLRFVLRSTEYVCGSKS